MPQYLVSSWRRFSLISVKHILGLVPVWSLLGSCFMACSSFFSGPNILNLKVQNQSHFLVGSKMQASCWKTQMLCLWFSWVLCRLVLYGFHITLRFQTLCLNTGRFPVIEAYVAIRFLVVIFDKLKISKRMTGREIAAMFMLGTVVEVISRPIYGFLSKKIEVWDLKKIFQQLVLQ